MKRLEVVLTNDARADLVDIYDFLAGRESLERADEVVARLEEAVESLGRAPLRGAAVRELLELGITEYRQALSGPWRIIYRIIGRRVVVFVVADGRRDMTSLLARRLLAP